MAEEDSTLWMVNDKIATRAGGRVHKVHGIDYILYADLNKPARMPAEVAMVFLKEGFIVRDANGDIVQSIPEGNGRQAGAGELRLKRGETVARYDELNIEGLRARVANIPNGDVLAKLSKKQELIAALLKNDIMREESAKARKGEAPAVDLADRDERQDPAPNLDEMSDDELDGAFEDAV